MPLPVAAGRRLAYQVAFAFDDHFHRLADQLLVILYRHFLLHGQQVVVALPLDFIGNVIGKPVDRHRSGPRGILENEAILKPATADEIGGDGKIVVAFAWETRR